MALAVRHEQDDGALLDQLARLIEQLRTNRYGSIVVKVRDVSSLAAEEFSDLFSRHLLYEEEILFPVLREPAPVPAGRMLEDLRREHGKLRSFAQDLVRRVQSQDLDAACETGRLFMAALLDHIHRESVVTNKLLHGLDARSAARLQKLLDLDRKPE